MSTASKRSLLLAVLGTDTEVGKTWLSAQLLSALAESDISVAARKPVQSFDPGSDEARDAEILADATGENCEIVCPPQRCYPAAMAPPMAADSLGLPRVRIADLVDELQWPPDVGVRLLETVGGVRSPISHDADSLTLAARVEPTHCLLVADAGLGTINSVRLSLGAIDSEGIGAETAAFLNHFEESELHHRNLEHLRSVDSFTVFTNVAEVVDWILST